METNSEILKKIKTIAKQKNGFVYFAIEKNNKIEIGLLLISLNENDRINLNKMDYITNQEGFKFWLNSEEGEKWYIKNKNSLLKIFEHTIKYKI